jgi:hypothetical protein
MKNNTWKTPTLYEIYGIVHIEYFTHLILIKDIHNFLFLTYHGF